MYENLVGLHVTDESAYQEYRNAMLPILQDYGGGFRYDFKVSEVLLSRANHKINRVFTIYFPTKEISKEFFTNFEYLKAKKRYFNHSVKAVTIIAEYHQ